MLPLNDIKVVFYGLDFATKALVPKYRNFKQANLFHLKKSHLQGLRI